jgi:drug/metabolite transporter (DMT)-like permease
MAHGAGVAVTTAFPLATALVVIFAGMLHATWNALARATADRLATFAIFGVVEATCGAIGIALTPSPAVAAWPYLAVSTVLQTLYVIFLIRSYRLGDFNQVYPIARGSAPLLVAIVATVVVGDRTTGAELAGIAVICAGLGVLALARPRGNGAPPHWPAVRAALLTGVTIAAYTIVDGVGVRLSGTAAGYGSWLFLLMGPPIVGWVLAVRGRALIGSARTQLWRGVVGGLLTIAGYGIVLWAQTTGSLAVVAALRETGVITGAVIGVFVFRERAAVARIAAAVTVAAGAALINLR